MFKIRKRKILLIFCMFFYVNIMNRGYKILSVSNKNINTKVTNKSDVENQEINTSRKKSSKEDVIVKNASVKNVINKLELVNKKSDKNDKLELIDTTSKTEKNVIDTTSKLEKNVSCKNIKTDKVKIQTKDKHNKSQKNSENENINQSLQKHDKLKKDEKLKKKEEELNLSALGLTKEEEEYNLQYFSNKEKKNVSSKENKKSTRKNIAKYYDYNVEPYNIGDYDFSLQEGLNFITNRYSKKEFEDLIEKTEKYLESLKKEYSYLYKGTDKTGLFDYQANVILEYERMMRSLFLDNMERYHLKKILFENDLELEKYFRSKIMEMYGKYGGKIYLNADRLGLSLKEILNFNLEFREKMKYDALYDEDLFVREGILLRRQVEDYKLLKLFTKNKRQYLWFVDDETKINVLVILFGENLKHVIFIRNPNEIVLKEANKIKKIKKIINKDGIQFILDNIGVDYINMLYPCLKEQFFYNSKDILFIIKDSFEKFFDPEVAYRLEFEDLKYQYILKMLRDKLFHNLYDDEYPLKEEVKSNENEKKTESCDNQIYKISEINDDNFFNKENVKHKYVAQLTYDLDCDARFKDIFNLDSEYLNKNFKKLINEYGYDKIEIKPQDQEDVFVVKFYGDNEKFIKKKELNNLMIKIMDNILKKTYDKDFFDMNIVIKKFKHYLNDKEALDSYYERRPVENRFRTALLKTNKIYLYRNFAVGVIDWSEKYRGYIPIIDLIIKSFSKFKVPFSNKVIDVEDNYIEDYVLRVYENMRCGTKTFERTIKKGPKEVEIFKNSV